MYTFFKEFSFVQYNVDLCSDFLINNFSISVFSVSSLIILEFTAGLVTTSVFALMMSCSLKAPTSFQATHYSVLSSVETAGKLLFSSIAGALIDWMGLPRVYFIFVILSAPTVLILPFIEC